MFLRTSFHGQLERLDWKQDCLLFLIKTSAYSLCYTSGSHYHRTLGTEY